MKLELFRITALEVYFTLYTVKVVIFDRTKLDLSDHIRVNFQEYKKKAILKKMTFSEIIKKLKIYLIFVSLKITCLRTTGSYLKNSSFSVFVRGFFLVT